MADVRPLGKTAVLESLARMLGVTRRSPTFTSVVDSGSADGMPIDFLDHFFDDELLSDWERSEWVASRRVLTWSLECLQAELQAAATVYVRSGLCYAPSPRGQPYRSASTGKGWCGLILLAAFPNANTKDANVYVDPETGAYQSCYTWDELDAFTRAATWPPVTCSTWSSRTPRTTAAWAVAGRPACWRLPPAAALSGGTGARATGAARWTSASTRTGCGLSSFGGGVSRWGVVGVASLPENLGLGVTGSSEL